MAEPDDLSVKLRAALGRQAIGLLVSRCILLLEALDRLIVEETANCPVKCTRTQLHPPIAKLLYVFEESIAMLGG